ncbi:MAG: YdcF family protein [Bacteroidota bacterium]
MKVGTIRHIMKSAWHLVRGALLAAGAVAVIAVILAFTTAPFWIWYKMGVKTAGINRPPDYIVVLGGGGMPSESGLMRCWYGAKAARRFNRANVIVSLPGEAGDSLSSVNLMKKELEIRGVAPERVLLEDSGTNTRAEALQVLKLINRQKGVPVAGNNAIPGNHGNRVNLLIVTSPEHLLRAVLTFKKAGFLKVDGLPAFEKTIECDLTFTSKMTGGRKWVPDVGNNITVRYEFWRQMNYEFLVLREYAALLYYKLQGWA